ncbi:anthranilate synthase component I family protein [Ferruginibacter yonginensis]|uniref:Anthranilate synthase component I family protein n=1 Tax=Ferruginibacter yonginensis TaxID=1310416 RepID=A0ABV8QVF6_9BACT
MQQNTEITAAVIALKFKMLNWANQFNIFCLLDNNGYQHQTSAFECLLAVGVKRSFEFKAAHRFDALQQFYNAGPGWLFGHLGYNAAGNAYSTNNVLNTSFGDGFLFEPVSVIRLDDKAQITVLQSIEPSEKIIAEILQTPVFNDTTATSFTLTHQLSKQAYIQKIEQIKAHIQRGDCYEANFCMEFLGNVTSFNAITAYQKLTAISAAPFGAFYKLNQQYCLCASPERFLKKQGSLLQSQPIKGTAKRSSNFDEDHQNKTTLRNSKKEQSENVMVVDLVRNDMSQVSTKASVKVTELFGIYSFPQVHQMISTIECTLQNPSHFAKALAVCYPMGSMTGAPKKRVMEIIENTELTQRGLFSGALGYITPDGDFDFNVVIRSLFYNEAMQQVSFFAGSGITYYCDAAAEYDECMAKAAALLQVLQ